MMSTGLPCDQVGGSTRIERATCAVGETGQRAAEIAEAVGREDAGAAAVGEDREPLAGERRMPRERSRRR